MIDAKQEELEFIRKTINKYIPECEIRVFGSRIKGNARYYSDIDLAIVADRQIEWRLIDRIKDEFAESELPYRVDILDWHSIDESFKKVIEREYLSF